MNHDHTPPDPELAPAFRRLPAPSPPEALETRVASALRARGAFRRSGGRARWMLAAGALAAAALATVVLTRPGQAPAAGPEFLLLITEDARYRAPADSAEALARVQEYGAWAGRLARAGQLVSAGELAPAGVALHADGQAAAGPEGLSGYFLIRAASPEAAVRLAQDSPHLKYGGTVVVRAVLP